MSRLIVGIIGPIGSGKSTASEFLVNKGFVHLRFSAEIEKEIKKRGLTFERKTYQDLGNEWRAKKADFISQRILKTIAKLQKDSKVVIEGCRNSGEIYPFKKLKNFYLIGLNAPVKVRFERVNKLSRDPKTWKEFLVGEMRDFGVGEPSWGQDTPGCLKLADIVISTDKVKSKVNQEIEKFLKLKGVL